MGVVDPDHGPALRRMMRDGPDDGVEDDGTPVLALADGQGLAGHEVSERPQGHGAGRPRPPPTGASPPRRWPPGPHAPGVLPTPAAPARTTQLRRRSDSCARANSSPRPTSGQEEGAGPSTGRSVHPGPAHVRPPQIPTSMPPCPHGDVVSRPGPCDRCEAVSRRVRPPARRGGIWPAGPEGPGSSRRGQPPSIRRSWLARRPARRGYPAFCDPSVAYFRRW